jgi:hypothetical protein
MRFKSAFKTNALESQVIPASVDLYNPVVEELWVKTPA